MKHKKLHPGFETESLCPFPYDNNHYTTSALYIYIYIYIYIYRERERGGDKRRETDRKIAVEKCVCVCVCERERERERWIERKNWQKEVKGIEGEGEKEEGQKIRKLIMEKENKIKGRNLGLRGRKVGMHYPQSSQQCLHSSGGKIQDCRNKKKKERWEWDYRVTSKL